MLGEADYDVLLTGPARVVKPDGKPLAVYLPGVLSRYMQDETVYAVLHDLRRLMTENRGMASAAPRIKYPSQTRSKALSTPSAVIGALEGARAHLKYCRLTAWTGRNLPAMETLRPLLVAVADEMAKYVPERYAAQLGEAQKTQPDWVIPGTPFTTVTVNNTWPTGMHTDKGDLHEGFSTIACLRRGEFTGGRLMFPEYRVAVDLQDGDLILMDAHEWHANTPIVCRQGVRLWGWCDPAKEIPRDVDQDMGCGAERISVVSYFRTEMVGCGTAEQEHKRAAAYREDRPAEVIHEGPARA